jgi:hypothetical protein
MSDAVRVMVETGKKKAVVAALEWIGWDRGAKSEADALAVFARYRVRYAPVAKLAGLGREFDGSGPVEIVEHVVGSGQTDFYGLSARSATEELEAMSDATCDRRIALLRACWSYFDGVGQRVSPELRKGPRGGGRDRDLIVRHARVVEALEFAVKVGIDTSREVVLTPDGVAAYRDAYCAAIRAHQARGEAARTWSLPYLVRHSAYHMLDHAWEMEDRDLSGASLREPSAQ